MRERVGIAAAALAVVFGAHTAAAASIPGADDVDDVADGVTSSATETVDSTVDAVEDTVEGTASGGTKAVEDTAETATKAVEDTAETATKTVEDTASGATKTVEDTASGATKTVEDTASGATKTVEDTTGAATGTVENTATGTVENTTGAATGTVKDAAGTAPASGGATAGGTWTGNAAPAGSAPASGSADTGTPGGATGGYAAQQPDGQGSFLQLHDALGWSAPGGTLLSLAGTSGQTVAARAGASLEPRDGLVATVRVSGREPFVASVRFGRPADMVTVHLEPTGDPPLAGPDGDVAATEPFSALVMLPGEDAFRADVRVIVRDDGLVLLVEPAASVVAAATEVLARVVDRLASTGLPLLALAVLALGLLTVGGLAVRWSRSRPRWSPTRSP